MTLVNPPRLNHLTRRTSYTKEPPLGLAYVAASLRREGYDVRVIDGEAQGLGLEETVARATEGDPLFVGLTADTTVVKSAARVAEAIKAAHPSLPVVIGGYHATVMPNDTLEEFDAFDVAVFGEGETTAVELAAALASGETLKDLRGTAYREDGTIVRNPPRRPTPLDDLPFPAWDLLPLRRYRPHYRPDDSVLELPVNTGRGCRGRCTFCARVSGGVIRRRSVESIVEEIRYDVEVLNAGAIVFFDETFTADPELVAELCERMIQLGLPEKVYWLCMTRVDAVTPDILRLMARAGCRIVAFGVESGNAALLESSGKATDPGQIATAVAAAQAAGMQVDAFFVLGLPGETRGTIRKTVDFAIELDPDFANFFILVPYPGTKVFQMAKRGQAGLRLLSCDWDQYGIQMGGALELEDLTRAQLERAQLTAYLRFYMRFGKVGNMLRMVNLRVLPTYVKNLVQRRLALVVSSRSQHGAH